MHYTIEADSKYYSEFHPIATQLCSNSNIKTINAEIICKCIQYIM